MEVVITDNVTQIKFDTLYVTLIVPICHSEQIFYVQNKIGTIFAYIIVKKLK